MIETVEYEGWPNCLRLANEKLELIATTDVGPRIISLATPGGPNLFATFADQLGLVGGSDWRIYGGHRLWHAPEVVPRTYAPDNGPVRHAWDGQRLTLSTEEPETGLARRLTLTMAADEARVTVGHRLVNHNPWAIELAPWALSVMAPGGRAVVPQEPHRSHPEALSPARPLVLWPYTDMSDPRWTWGRRYVQLRQDPAATTKQKAGVLNTTGWAAYLLDGLAFIKRYPYVAGAAHADMGCNTELFTDSEFLELETLGPLTRLEPGGHVDHVETWLLEPLEVGPDEDELDRVLRPIAERGIATGD